MQKENYVSLWFGKTKSAKNLDNILKIKYTATGDFIPSEFAKSFNIRRYDDDFREAEFYEEPTNNIFELLGGYSYDDILIEHYKGLLGEELSEKFNAVILLYNFEYDGEIKDVDIGSSHYKYIGSTKYRK